MNRHERDRKHVKNSGSPLGSHSLNHEKMHAQRDGAVRLFGIDSREARALARREDQKCERQQALYDSAVKLFEGIGSEEDVLKVIFLADEFEDVDGEVPGASTIDFQGLQTTSATFGEPEFFRK